MIRRLVFNHPVLFNSRNRTMVSDKDSESIEFADAPPRFIVRQKGFKPKHFPLQSVSYWEVQEATAPTNVKK